MAALGFVCKHCCFVSLRRSSSLNSSLPVVLEKGKENFRGTATPQAPSLPELLVFTFPNLKNSGGIHTALTPSGIPVDFPAQKREWERKGEAGGSSFPETQASLVLSSEECSRGVTEAHLHFLFMWCSRMREGPLDITQASELLLPQHRLPAYVGDG